MANAVWQVGVDEDWLTADELAVCLAQPTPVPLQSISEDAPRPDSVALAKAVLSAARGASGMAQWCGGKHGLLLFPEYSFSSEDFPTLDALVRAFPSPIVMLAGFGVARGSVLRDMLESGGCEASWPDDGYRVDDSRVYNAAWCWVHTRPESTSCHLFLKNFLEQRIEVAIPDMAAGDYILQVTMRDFVLFPLICADLICTSPDNPRERIRGALPTIDGRPDRNKRVLVAALLYEMKPYHGLWRPAINDVAEMHGHTAGLCLVNQPVGEPQLSTQDDAWRCLSGGFISRNIMGQAPQPNLPYVRFVSTDSASGLVLRHRCAGAAFGAFRWTDGATNGRNVWAPTVRYSFSKGLLQKEEESPECCEFRRYVIRHRRAISDRYGESAARLLDRAFDAIATANGEHLLKPRLWPRLVSGPVRMRKEVAPDDIDTVTKSLDCALAAYAAVEDATCAAPRESTEPGGQLLWGEREVLVWSDPEWHSLQMEQALREFALDSGPGASLVVIGGGCVGSNPARHAIDARHGDITLSRASGGITESRTRCLEWVPINAVEDVLLDDNTSAEQKRTFLKSLLISDGGNNA